jgi:hypothetical protein
MKPKETKMNRVKDMITKIQNQLMSNNPSLDKQEAASKGLDLTFAEHARFQEVKSLAQLQGKLSLDEANVIYRYLGPSPDTFNGQALAAKLALSLLIAELMTETAKEKR